MKIKKKKIIIVIVIVLIAVAAIAWFATKATGKGNENQSNDVETANLEKRTLTNYVSATGTIQSDESKTITSTLTNYEIKTVKFSVGDVVQAGDILCTFINSDIEQQIKDTKAALSSGKEKNDLSINTAERQLQDTVDTKATQAENGQKNVNQADDMVDEAKVNVNDTNKQYQNAIKQTVAKKSELEQASVNVNTEQAKQAYNEAISNEKVCKQTYEAAKTSLESAENNYDNAVSARDTANKNNASAVSNMKDSLKNAKLNTKTNLTSQERQLESYEDNLSKCVVKAPIGGIVTSVSAIEGEIYKGGELVTIENDKNLIISAEIDEYDISDITLGMVVLIRTDATDDEELEGEITFISPTPKTNQGTNSITTGAGVAYEVHISIKELSDRLRIGMTAKLSIILESKKDVYAVPYDAVQTNSNGETVIYALENALSGNTDNQSEQKEIKVDTGLETDYYTEIISDDIKEDMKVVIPLEDSEDKIVNNTVE